MLEPVAPGFLRQRTKSYNNLAHAGFKDLNSHYDNLRRERTHKLAKKYLKLLMIEFRKMMREWVRKEFQRKIINTGVKLSL